MYSKPQNTSNALQLVYLFSMCKCYIFKTKKTHFNCEIRGFDTVQNNFMDLPTHILAL